MAPTSRSRLCPAGLQPRASEIKGVFADGDFVILHLHMVREPGARGSSQVDIFRLEDGKPVEHWDVVQPIAEHFVHGNGPF